MHRRNFIKGGSVAGLALSAASMITACAPESKAHQNGNTFEEQEDKFELNEMTIDQLQQKMKDGSYTSHAITQLYLKRIEEVDKAGPTLNAVIEVNPDAIAMADAMDSERKNGKIRGPLHGIPVLVKDNIDIVGKMMTTAGSLALEGHHAAEDAFIIKQLKAAGAVILGKTNLSEWANFRSTHSTSAWSCRGRQTRMPYILDRNPSGSSSGSGSGTAANLCAVAIGTETDGSVVSPSSVNGLVGIKPTVGLLSRSGIIPISKTQDTAGPMARTVKDAAMLLGALTGVDSADPYTAAGNGKAHTDYTKFLEANSLQGKRIGIEKAFLKGSPDVVNLYKSAVETLKAKGATVVEIDLLSKLKEAGDAEFQVLLYEFKDGLNQYLAKATDAKVKSLADVIAFNKENAARTMPFFQQETLEMAQAKGDLNSKEYKDALQKSNAATRQIIDGIMSENKLDAISGVTNGVACCIDLINGDYDTGFTFSSPPAMAGYPHITVPMGQVHGLPVGFSFFAGPYQEPQLIALGYAFEQATKKRTPPKFVKSFIS